MTPWRGPGESDIVPTSTTVDHLQKLARARRVRHHLQKLNSTKLKVGRVNLEACINRARAKLMVPCFPIYQTDLQTLSDPRAIGTI